MKLFVDDYRPAPDMLAALKAIHAGFLDGSIAKGKEERIARHKARQAGL